ncbi:MAG: hypothetical protein NC111_04955 [Bacteroides sp.]|nr:hypothetical protein [Bacteroides sp.]MCM1413676.1 hypothetical protein [Bacteroides sp.]MCM1471855.1 hypothetical protein [Bacteroides sp.]
MERMKLTVTEKRCLKLLSKHGIDALDTMAKSQVCRALRTLEDKSLINVAWIEGDDFEDACITSNGKAYLIENPKLRNPTDWNKIGAIAAIVAALVSIVVLFIACTRLSL